MIQRILSALVGLLFLVAVFLFTSFLVALTMTVGLLLAAWTRWRGGKQRARVIDGEYRIIESK
jgi:hypothetical protein